MTQKKIFTSQNSMDNGRNRPQRRLIARIDSQINRFEGPFILESDTGGELSLLPKSDTTFQSPPAYYCKYYKTICPDNIHHYSMKCIFNKNKCNIKKYFDRYRGLNINELGVGV